MRLTRRQAILSALAAAGVSADTSDRIGHDRIGAITDEIARSPEGAIDFAHQYGLKWLELRDVPGAKGTDYFFMEEAGLREAARQFTAAGLRISFLNTNLLKFGLPGTDPSGARRKIPMRGRSASRATGRASMGGRRSAKCIRSAQILGCRYVRVFSFSRVPEPAAVSNRVAEVLNEFARVAEAEGVMLLLENETILQRLELRGTRSDDEARSVQGYWDQLGRSEWQGRG